MERHAEYVGGCPRHSPHAPAGMCHADSNNKCF